jgi:hypothetical protein
MRHQIRFSSIHCAQDVAGGLDCEQQAARAMVGVAQKAIGSEHDRMADDAITRTNHERRIGCRRKPLA